jgi:tRNA(Ile)-lysidine synthase
MDDQAETVIVNLLRGAALDGLAAMAPPGHPLLGLRRSETRELCRALALVPVDDPTNDDRRFLRNRVRHEVLPLLEDAAQRDLAPVLARQADLLRDEAALLDALADALDPTDALALAAAPVALARRAVRRWLGAPPPGFGDPSFPPDRLSPHPPDAAAIERVLAVARGEAVACELAGGRRVVRSGQRLRQD